MSPTARSLEFLRENGYTAQVVEKWNPWAKIRQDLYGFIDIVAMKPGEQGVLGVQATTKAHQTNRMGKAKASDNLSIWLGCGNRFEVWGWAKQGARGERKIWQLERRTANE